MSLNTIAYHPVMKSIILCHPQLNRQKLKASLFLIVLQKFSQPRNQWSQKYQLMGSHIKYTTKSIRDNRIGLTSELDRSCPGKCPAYSQKLL